MGLFSSKEEKLWGQAEKSLKNNDYDTAIKISTECISQFPNCIDAYHVRAMAYKEKGDYKRAITDMNQVIKFDPTGYQYYARSRMYSDMGDIENEIADLTKSIEFGGFSIHLAKEKLAEAQAKL